MKRTIRNALSIPIRRLSAGGSPPAMPAQPGAAPTQPGATPPPSERQTFGDLLGVDPNDDAALQAGFDELTTMFERALETPPDAAPAGAPVQTTGWLRTAAELTAMRASNSKKGGRR